MEHMKLTFVNVGYGEAILAECPSDGGFTMLIDGGGAEPTEYAGSRTGRITLAGYLKRRGIRRLDMLLSTHIHEDHVCGLLAATEEAPPARMWQALPEDFWREMEELPSDLAKNASMDKFLRALSAYRTLCRRLTERGCEVLSVSAGFTAQLCPGLTARVLGPGDDRAADLARRLRDVYHQPDSREKERRLAAIDADMNNYSVMLSLNYRGTRLLLPGDTNNMGYGGLETELRADLFKLGHHGQKDSVTPELLGAIAPRHAVCCASSDRRYNSGHPDVLALLRRSGVRCWFSDCPEGEGVPPHRALTFDIGSGGEISGDYQ